MKIDMDDNQALNPDAIYAAMAWLREYAESPEGLEEYRRLEERRKAAIYEHELTEGDTPLAIPYLRLLATTIEGIYPGEAESIHIGIDLADAALRETPDQVVMRMQDMGPDDPRVVALSRFIADRAN